MTLDSLNYTSSPFIWSSIAMPHCAPLILEKLMENALLTLFLKLQKTDGIFGFYRKNYMGKGKNGVLANFSIRVICERAIV